MRKSVFAALALAVATMATASCGEQPTEAADAAEAPTLTASNARLMLPAVAGNPGAVYFDVANSGASNMMIRAVSVAGAGSTMMHMTSAEAGMQETLQLAVEAGKTVKFEPGGNHLMAMDLADTVTAGSQAEVTLTFVGGDELKFPAEVRAAGDER